MRITDEDCRTLKGNGSVCEPLAVKPNEAARLIAVGRSTIYELLAEGRLKAVKAGATTLILMDSLRGYLESLPPVRVRSPKKAA